MTRSDHDPNLLFVLPSGVRRDPRLLRNLQYFEAVARLSSVTAAAAELGVSLSAVSHQIRELSERIGEVLLDRSGRGIKLTPVGRQLAENLTETFAMIDASISSVVGGRHAKLSMSVCSAFGPSWLVPRLPTFLHANPTIDAELRLYAEVPELSSLSGDVIFTAGPLRQGYTAIPIFEEFLIAVRRPGTSASRFAMITTDISAKELGADWYSFGRATGLDIDRVRIGGWTRSSHYLLAMEMAKAGVGVAIVPDFQAAEALRNGLLERVSGTLLPSNRAYNFCFKASRANEPEIRAFVRWLRKEVRDYVKEANHLASAGIASTLLN